MADLGVAPQGGEPFFDRLQQLQPDVDVVVLPPAVTTRRTATPTSPDETRRIAVQLDALVDDLTRRAGLPERRSAIWRRTEPPLVVREVRVRAEVSSYAEAISVLRALREALRADGWHPVPTAGPRPGMTATSPEHDTLTENRRGCRLEAWCARTPSAELVEVVVRSAPFLPVPDALEGERGPQ